VLLAVDCGRGRGISVIPTDDQIFYLDFCN